MYKISRSSIKHFNILSISHSAKSASVRSSNHYQCLGSSLKLVKCNVFIYRLTSWSVPLTYLSVILIVIVIVKRVVSAKKFLQVSGQESLERFSDENDKIRKDNLFNVKYIGSGLPISRARG